MQSNWSVFFGKDFCMSILSLPKRFDRQDDLVSREWNMHEVATVIGVGMIRRQVALRRPLDVNVPFNLNGLRMTRNAGE